MNTDNRSFEMLEELKYFGTNLTSQNFIQEEIKCRLKSGNTCYHSVQNLLFSSFLFKHRTVIFPIIVYWCETWSLTLREESRLRVFENRVLRTFEPKRDEVAGSEEAHPILFE
jgi:hypothetical protein